jgi:restriction endonuclease S subunit
MTEWQTKTVGEIADTQLGKMLNKGKQTGRYPKPYLRTDNVHWGRFDLSEVKEMDILPDEQDKYLATKGDLLMCEGGASGRTAIWNEDYDISFQNHVHRIRPKDPKEILPKYLLYYFEWFIKNGFASDLIKGVTISSLSQSGLRSIEVNYPSIDEQLKIVELLEDYLSRLDGALAEVKQAKTKSAQFRRSLLQAAFTGNLSAGGDSFNTALPGGWKSHTLRDWGMEAQSGFASGSHNSEGNGIIHLRPMNVSRLGKLDFANFKSVEDSSSRRIKKGDILFNNTNSAELVGKTALVNIEGDFAFSNHMTRLRFPSDKVLHEYMAILLHSLWMSGYFNEICSNHVNQASVSIKRLEQVEVSLPPIDEQRKIVELIEDHLARLDMTVSMADAMEMQSIGLRRSLLHTAFTGQLTNEVLSV